MAGRPPIAWTPDDVERFQKLCAMFCTKAEVCSVMGIGDHRTLDRLIAEHFPDTPTWEEAFEMFSGTGRAHLRRRMFELAMDGDKAAIIFMAKNYLGMSDDGPRESKAGSYGKPETGGVAKIVDKSRFANRRASNE